MAVFLTRRSSQDKNWRFLIFITLLTMLLMRLVWMQLRSFEPRTDYRSMLSFALSEPSCFPENKSLDRLGVYDFFEAKDLKNQHMYQWFRSSGFSLYTALFCEQNGFDFARMLKFNLWIFVAELLLLALTVRIVGGSWILVLATIVTVASRGELIAGIARLDVHGLIAALLIFWLACTVHFFRTASLWSMIGFATCLYLGSLLDSSLIMLSFVLPSLLMSGFLMRRFLVPKFIQRLRTEKKQVKSGGDRHVSKNLQVSVLLGTALAWMKNIISRQSERTDGLPVKVQQNRAIFLSKNPFAVLEVPFAIWVASHKRWLRLTLTLSAVAATVVAFGMVVNFKSLEAVWPEFLIQFHGKEAGWDRFWLENWFKDLIQILDVQYVVSLFVIFVSSLQSPARGLRGFFEASWTIGVSLLLVSLLSCFFDYRDGIILRSVEGEIGSWSLYAWNRSSHLLRWFEPIVLAMGVVGVYHLMAVFLNVNKDERD